jgi:hypothetical protein
MHSLTLALDGGEWSASHPCHFTPRERAPGTQIIVTALVSGDLPYTLSSTLV